MKAQVQIGEKPENNRGKVLLKPIKVICGPRAGERPSQEFKDAKEILDTAFNDTDAIHALTDDNKASWEFER